VSVLKVLFMGTPHFAAHSLEALLEAGYPVVGVVTQPDKPVGRGGKVQFSAVKQVAHAHGLPIFQPKRVRHPEVIAALRELRPEITVVVAFGQILSAEALRISPLGSLNVHGSVLPCWRGAAPIQRAIMAGDTETGITTMWMDEGMDTGDICLIARIPIAAAETAGSLHDRLATLGAELLVQTLRQVEAGMAPRTPQPMDGITHAAKIERSDERIEWTRSAAEIVNQVRALAPTPLAQTSGPKGIIKVVQASLYGEGSEDTAAPGTVVALVKKRGLVVQTGRGHLLVEAVQPQGKSRMDALSYVNGGGIAVGDRLGSDA
jgi:methionyl-tRNA formyltransferase